MLFHNENISSVSHRIDHLDSSSNLQIAHLCLPKGHKVSPHHHVVVSGQSPVSEIWIVLEGTALVDFYVNKVFSRSSEIASGDVLLTHPGFGHALTVTSDDFKMVEIKNGPYSPSLTEPI